MFCWYQQAEKGYVYPSDVSSNGNTPTKGAATPGVESSFQSMPMDGPGMDAPTTSNSFVRGVSSKKGQRLGDEKSFEGLLRDITRIPIAALRDTPVSEFSETERISWSDTRSTKKEEDMAYSLLGLFGVHMLMIYGEGKRNALRRLREEIGKQASQPCISSRTTHFIVSFGKEGFVGRDSIMAQLLEKIPPSVQKDDC